MRLCGLRLLVALLTFGAGVAISSLWSYLRAPQSCPKYTSARPLSVSTSETLIIQDEVPDPTLQSESLTPLEQCKLGQFSLDAQELFAGGRNSQGTGMVRSLFQNKSVSKPQPRYPAEAKEARVGGVVGVQIVVNEEGNVITARAVSGHELLRDTAVDAACRVRFSPLKVSGQPVKFVSVIQYNFVLQ